MLKIAHVKSFGQCLGHSKKQVLFCFPCQALRKVLCPYPLAPTFLVAWEYWACFPEQACLLSSEKQGVGYPCVPGGRVGWETAPLWGGVRTPIPTEACAVLPAGQQQAVAVSMILNSTVNR